MSNPIYAVKLEAKVVTLNSSYTTVVAQEIVTVRTSTQAKAYAASLDVGKNTHSSVKEYLITLTGSGAYGDIVTYLPNVFVIQVEPRLILAPYDEE